MQPYLHSLVIIISAVASAGDERCTDHIKCKNGGFCIAGKCECPALFTGFFCEQRVNFCYPISPCAHSSVCESNESGYVCTCSPGYTGRNCEDIIDNCASRPCLFDGTCHKKVGGYKCECHDGYIGERCEAVVRRCQIHSPCSKNGVCSEKPAGGQTCSCMPGYAGPTCSDDINECSSNPCIHGNCIDLTNSYSCQCLPGYMGDNCDLPMNDCSYSPCLNSAVCMDIARNKYRCECVPGFTGTNCETNIDDCSPNSCLHHEICIDLINKYRCACPEGMTGSLCNIVIDSCRSNPCLNSGTCIVIKRSFKCLCVYPYTGKICEMDVDVCFPNPCLHGGTCIKDESLLSHFRCDCSTGFIGDLCEGDIYECASQPCMNQGTCVENTNGTVGYTCVCHRMYYGAVCEHFRTKCQSGGNCTVDRLDASKCLGATCQNGGTCSQSEESVFVCLCPPGIEGKFCDVVSSAEFTGTTYVELSPIIMKNFPSAIDIKLTFRTTVVADGILVYMSTPRNANQLEQVGVELHKGYLRLTVTTNNMQTDIRRLNLYQDERGLYQKTIQLAVYEHKTRLVLGPDDCNQSAHCMVTLGHRNKRTKLSGSLYIGGVKVMSPFMRAKLRSTTGFIGCLSNLLFNNESVSLAKKSGKIPDTENHTVTTPIAGCRQHSPCTENYCRNGGKCVDKWSKKSCDCSSAFTGEFCEIQNSEQTWLCVSIVTGSIHVTISTKGRLYRDLLGKMMLNGEWHTLVILLTHDKYVSQVIDSSQRVVAESWLRVKFNAPVKFPLYLGSIRADESFTPLRKSVAAPHTSFEGCIRDVRINHTLVNLSRSARTEFPDDLAPAHVGCPLQDSCINGSACSNNGACIPGWEKATCRCHGDFIGKTCSDELSTSFDGVTSRVTISLDRSKFPFGDEGSFEIRSQDERSCVLLMQLYDIEGTPSDSLAFTILESHLTVIAILQSKEYELRFQVNVSDARWHAINWVTIYGVMDFSVDGLNMTLPKNINFFSPLYHAEMTVFVGGRPSNPENADVVIEHFRGCLRGLSFNGELVAYMSDLDSNTGLTSKPIAVTRGCDRYNVCENNRVTCPLNMYCMNLWDGYECRCFDGWEGRDCSISTDDCVDNLCLNNASCIDGHISYTCECTFGYSGQMCESEINECLKSACDERNSEACVPVFPADYKCICSSGWSGKNCDLDIDDCAVNPCQNGGTCFDRVDSFSCKCPKKFYGAYCEKVDACVSRPCFNGGTCLRNDLKFGYECECTPQYMGERCQTFDTCHPNLCQNGATCIRHKTNATCRCSKQHYGDYCEFIDRCVEKPCLTTTCHRDQSDYWCDCGKYHTGKNCDVLINMCKLVTNPCKHGICVFPQRSNMADYECVCDPGYTGVTCDLDVDECGSQPCQNGATCVDSAAAKDASFFVGYRCYCSVGYTGVHCDVEIDECYNFPCLNGGVCSDLIGRFQCDCYNGFVGRICEIDQRGCSSSPCLNRGKCVNRANGKFVCSCAKGFLGSRCEAKVKYCDQHVCRNQAVCVEAFRGYNCICKPGFTGLLCETVYNSCSSQPCLNKGMCRYIGVCSCNHTLASCQSDEACQKEVCIATDGCSLREPAYTCDCTGTGFTGPYCAEDIDECLNTSTCKNGGLCNNTVGGFKCNCDGTGYIGNTCEIDINECDTPDSCYNDGVCTNLVGGYKCACTKGWMGELCGENVDECLSDPCQNNSTCTDHLARFICNCSNTGFTGVTCNTDVDECKGDKHDCHRGSTCVNERGDYVCMCPSDVTGRFCETKVIGVLENEGNDGNHDDKTIIAIAVVITVAIVAVVGAYSTWWFRRMRRMKQSYPPAKVEISHTNVAMRTFDDMLV